MNEPDFAEPRRLYGLDECEIAWRTPHSIFVWWELSQAGLERAHRETPETQQAQAVLRLFVKHPASGAREHRDFPLSWHEGHQHLPCATSGSTVRVALGLLTNEGFFVPLAHSAVVRLPPAGPDVEVSTRWAQQELVDGELAAQHQLAPQTVGLRLVPPPATAESGAPSAFAELDRRHRRMRAELGGSSALHQANHKEPHGGR